MTANLVCALFMSGTQAQEVERLRLHALHVYSDADVPSGIFINHFDGFSSDGNNITYVYKSSQKAPIQQAIVGRIRTADGDLQRIPAGKALNARLLLNLAESQPMSLQAEWPAFAVYGNANLALQLKEALWQQSSPNGAYVNNVHIHTSGKMLFGHVCYPYPDFAQGIASGLYRWNAVTGIVDSIRVPRKHLYIAHLRKDNAWSARLNDSLCVMADMTRFRLWIAGSKGEPRLFEPGQPEGWLPYPDSLEDVYKRIRLMQGTLLAWDSLGHWLSRYSSIEKVYANSQGDIALRYTALDAENKYSVFIRIYHMHADSLSLVKVLQLKGWPQGEEQITMENYASTLLASGQPTFFMNDRSFVALEAVPKGMTLLGLKTRQELDRYQSAAMFGKKKMAVHVYR